MPFAMAGALRQGRGGSLKDLEFYRTAEEWPQPPDDPCTLADLSAETKTKPKEKKSNRRARKKMSESLAGITAAAVAVSGVIGWVGLVVPHLARKLVGNNYRHLMPCSILLGALFLLVVDNLSRNLLSTVNGNQPMDAVQEAIEAVLA